MSEVYTHRNGETEPPTITGAYFWFFGYAYDGSPDVFGMLFVLDGFASSADGDNIPLDKLRGRWWGPVAPPWVDEQF